MTDAATTHPLAGWSIAAGLEETQWQPWGAGDDARAKVLADADGYFVCLIDAKAGYRGGSHTHTNPEFLYVIDGEVRTQGVVLTAGQGYAAATGSEHTDFETLTDATYLSIFKL